jgi:anti-sigma B factor antagonist
MDLSIAPTASGNVTRLAVTGEVDVSNASILRDALDKALGKDVRLEVDMSDVPYIDSTGIGVLVGTAHRATELGGSLAVMHPQANVSRVLGLLGVADDLNVIEGD